MSNHDVLALLNLQLFLFRQKRIAKICLQQTFMSGSNTREATDLKDNIATGKRSPVIRLVCGPLLVFIAVPHS